MDQKFKALLATEFKTSFMNLVKLCLKITKRLGIGVAVFGQHVQGSGQAGAGRDSSNVL